MPHMSPMMWSSTYLMVILMMMMMSTMLFFHFAPESKKCEMKMDSKLNWKW
uniref:ATP synthase F0 subunit 8 n=1 Tax=Brachyrhynchus triangulus TaxID=1452780 RepID=UPI001FF4D962|nr:ATP synthase F0 subunit 8 [Brachyrhynchus triangulus]UOG86753.1 ATP synthase F0 subunit 8 [Brachyrhynchus triangulus]UPL65808.1 ATPase subunit 8 [Brachyrhynchus triangulus]